MRYAGLCESAVHAGPTTAPQAYNAAGIPTLGAVFQEEGRVASLNELAGATAVCAVGLLRCLTLGDRREGLKEAAVKVLHAVGGVDLEAVRGRFGCL